MATPRKAVEAFRERAELLDFLLEVSRITSETLDLDKLLANVADIVKVILETALLTDPQKVAACELAKAAGADFVKTSTGFGPGGATVEDIALMRRTVGPSMGVKASGGVRTLADLKKMVAAGASHVGASASVKIVEATAA